MTYVVVIPSYERVNILKEKTLKMLKEGGVPLSRVYVFVADKQEEAAYKAAGLGAGIKIVVGKLGITNQRVFIRQYFPPKTKIVSLDDDVECLLNMDPVTHKLVPFAANRLHAFFDQAFKTAAAHKMGLWGIFPTPNPFYMVGQAPSSTTLKFVIGTVHGFVNSHGDIAIGDIEEKEDVEMTIQYYMRDGGVLRFNHVAFKTRFKNPTGGLGGVEKRFEANKRAAEYLAAKYPGCTRIKVRKNGMHEIVLRMRGPSCTVAKGAPS
jgi:hypothetical protein